MAGGQARRRGVTGAEHYLDLTDLYAARAARNCVVPLEQPAQPPVRFIGRKPRPSLGSFAFRQRNTGRRQLVTAAAGVTILLSILVRTALAG